MRAPASALASLLLLPILGPSCTANDKPPRTLPDGAMVALEETGGFMWRERTVRVSLEGTATLSPGPDGGCAVHLQPERLQALRRAVVRARAPRVPPALESCCDLVTTRLTTATFSVASTRPFEPPLDQLMALLRPLLREGCTGASKVDSGGAPR